MIKSKFMRKVPSVAIIFSAIFLSPYAVLANNAPIITDRISNVPIIQNDNYIFIRPIHTISASNPANRPIIIFEEDIITHEEKESSVDYIEIDFIPDFIIDEIKADDILDLTTDFIDDYIKDDYIKDDHIKLDDILKPELESEIIQDLPVEEEHTEMPQSVDVELIHWEEVKTLLSVGDIIPIYDILSGTTYNVHVLSNGSHADVETLTARDTEIKLEILNGEWNWTPRPVWVTIGERTVAASINGFPHDIYTIPDNNMDGHVCLHFYGSTTHNNNLEFAQLHQDILMEAWNMSFENWDLSRSSENWNQIRRDTIFTEFHKN